MDGEEKEELSKKFYLGSDHRPIYFSYTLASRTPLVVLPALFTPRESKDNEKGAEWAHFEWREPVI